MHLPKELFGGISSVSFISGNCTGECFFRSFLLSFEISILFSILVLDRLLGEGSLLKTEKNPSAMRQTGHGRASVDISPPLYEAAFMNALESLNST